jgi:hypothetical protein
MAVLGGEGGEESLIGRGARRGDEVGQRQVQLPPLDRCHPCCHGGGGGGPLGGVGGGGGGDGGGAAEDIVVVVVVVVVVVGGCVVVVWVWVWVRQWSSDFFCEDVEPLCLSKSEKVTNLCGLKYRGSEARRPVTGTMPRGHRR